MKAAARHIPKNLARKGCSDYFLIGDAAAAGRLAAKIVREYGPFPGVDSVDGVTFDGQHVWFASGDKLNAFDPASGKTVRSIAKQASILMVISGQATRIGHDAAGAELAMTE